MRASCWQLRFGATRPSLVRLGPQRPPLCLAEPAAGGRQVEEVRVRFLVLGSESWASLSPSVHTDNPEGTGPWSGYEKEELGTLERVTRWAHPCSVAGG